MDKKALSTLSYGMYVVGSRDSSGNANALIANSVFQVSSKVPMIAACISNEVHSHGLIGSSGAFSISVLVEDTPPDYVKKLGFYSGRDSEKVTGLEMREVGGIPVFLDHACAYFTCRVVKSLDCGTHTIFVGEVLEAEPVGHGKPLTYHKYKEGKGATPRTSPTFNVEKLKPRS